MDPLLTYVWTFFMAFILIRIFNRVCRRFQYDEYEEMEELINRREDEMLQGLDVEDPKKILMKRGIFPIPCSGPSHPRKFRKQAYARIQKRLRQLPKEQVLRLMNSQQAHDSLETLQSEILGRSRTSRSSTESPTVQQARASGSKESQVNNSSPDPKSKATKANLEISTKLSDGKPLSVEEINRAFARAFPKPPSKKKRKPKRSH